MKIVNAKVFLDGKFQDLEVGFKDGIITEIGKYVSDDEVIDAKGNYLYAGLIDPHMHGGFTYSFYENRLQANYDGIKECRAILKELPKHGVTSVLPTLVSDIDNSPRTLKEATRVVRQVRKEEVGADPFMIHYESPFFNVDRHASHNPVCQANPTKEYFLEMTDHDLSDIMLICVAPELPHAMDFIKWVTSEGVKVELCYTLANSSIIKEAADNGATQISHMYNGFEGMHHRINGPMVGCLLEDRLKAQIMCDTIHVAKDWVKLLIRVKGIDNVYGMTDNTSYSGLENGRHEFPNHQGAVIIDGDKVIEEDGTISGSNVTFDRMMKLARDKVGLTMEEVGLIYSENCAKCLDIKDRGKIEVGRRADFTLMDYDYNVLQTIIKGKTYYKK